MFPEDEDEILLESEQLRCLINRSACMLKLGNYEEAIQDCSVALRIDDTNVKALFRRSVAFRSIDKFGELS